MSGKLQRKITNLQERRLSQANLSDSDFGYPKRKRKEDVGIGMAKAMAIINEIREQMSKI